VIAGLRGWPTTVRLRDNETLSERTFIMSAKHFSVAIAFTIFMLAASALAQPQQQQEDKSKRPSPPGTADCTIKGKKVTIDYSRPFLKGRKLGQELAPYGKVWRTGANEATTLTTAIALDIGGAKVPAGTYTLYTLPSEGTWKLIINKQTGQSGTEYHQEQDLARVDMKKQEIVVPVEQFTIALDQDSNNSADLNLEWEKTRVFVTIRAQ
jgi:hypothetical protein